MLLLITLLTFLVLFLVFYLVSTNFTAAQSLVSMRLKALDNLTDGRSDINEELTKPFSQRVLSPLTTTMAGMLAQVTPRALRKIAEERMIAAGGFGDLSPNKFLLVCITLSISLPAVVSFVTAAAHAPANKIVGAGMLAFSVGAAFPFFMLSRKIAARKLSIQKDLPDVLDLLTVSVEAGLGFDGALAKLAEKMKGALVDEFNRVLQEIRMGVTRRDALHAMGARCGVQDLSLFTTSLVQADQLGVSIGNVLRMQSATMREKRRQRAKEMAMKAPVKMLIPMILFIFPTIFIVLLGPAVIQMMGSLISK